MITVITPTVPGRELLLAECHASVAELELPHLIEVDEDRNGPGPVRNRLIQQVSTEWTLFLDDDDVLYPNYVDTVTPHLAGSDVVYTAWDLSGAIDPVPLQKFDPDLLQQWNYIPVTACVRTDALKAVGGFPAAKLEDYALWLVLLAKGYRFTYVPTVAWHYRRFPGSRTERGVA